MTCAHVRIAIRDGVETGVIGLLQRVRSAYVEVDEQRVAEIGRGLMVLIGVERADTEAQMKRLLERLLGYRVFSDADNKMNLSLRDIHGALLLVPQFTLPANTNKGTRPSFSAAAPPATGRALFEAMVIEAKSYDRQVQCGVFGADMQVGLINDGPVTFWLHVR